MDVKLIVKINLQQKNKVIKKEKNEGLNKRAAGINENAKICYTCKKN